MKQLQSSIPVIGYAWDIQDIHSHTHARAQLSRRDLPPEVVHMLMLMLMLLMGGGLHVHTAQHCTEPTVRHVPAAIRQSRSAETAGKGAKVRAREEEKQTQRAWMHQDNPPGSDGLH